MLNQYCHESCSFVGLTVFISAINPKPGNSRWLQITCDISVAALLAHIRIGLPPSSLKCKYCELYGLDEIYYIINLNIFSGKYGLSFCTFLKITWMYFLSCFFKLLSPPPSMYWVYPYSFIGFCNLCFFRQCIRPGPGKSLASASRSVWQHGTWDF